MLAQTIALSPSCSITCLCNSYQNELELTYTEHSSDHWHGDYETCITINKDKAKEIVDMLQLYLREEAMTDNESRYREALERIVNLLYGDNRTDNEVYDIANEALNPEPEFEEVDAIAFMNIHTGDLYKGSEYRPSNVPIEDIIKLTGKIRRPVKKKVKRM